MGNIKTSFVKNIGKQLFEKHASEFTDDYAKNKNIMKGFVDIKSKKLRNIVAGYITSLKNQGQ